MIRAGEMASLETQTLTTHQQLELRRVRVDDGPYKSNHPLSNHEPCLVTTFVHIYQFASSLVELSCSPVTSPLLVLQASNLDTAHCSFQIAHPQVIRILRVGHADVPQDVHRVAVPGERGRHQQIGQPRSCTQLIIWLLFQT